MFTAIIQARMGSSRFPGKGMKESEGKPLLFYVIKQTLSSKFINRVIISTSIAPEDTIIVDFCKENGIDYYRGSINDVLNRFYECAKKFSCDPVIRISADSPLIDPNVIDRVLKKFLDNSYDYVSNNIEKNQDVWEESTCNFPLGTVIEVTTFSALEIAWKNSDDSFEREHVFPYIQSHPKLFNISTIKSKKNLSNIRITVDKKNDLKFVREIYKRIAKKNKFITIEDIEKIISKEPSLLEINNDVDTDNEHKKFLLMKEQKKSNV